MPLELPYLPIGPSLTSQLQVLENHGWYRPENQEAVVALMNNPEAFQALDFTALPSSLTHKDPEFMALVTKYFLEICQIAGNTTQEIYPILPEMNPEEVAEVKKMNEGKYDR